MDTSIFGSNEKKEVQASVETTAKRDPLARFKELTEDNQDKVQKIVDSVIEDVGGEGNVDLALLLAVLEKLNIEKKAARQAEKDNAVVRREAEKLNAGKKKDYVKSILKDTDNIDYYMATSKVTFVGIKVEKITDASARINVKEDTKVLYKGKIMTVADVNANGGAVSLGMKSAQLGKILKINGEDVVLPTAEAKVA